MTGQSNRPTARITIPDKAWGELMLALKRPEDVALRERISRAYLDHDLSCRHGPRLDLNATEIRLLARAVGYGLHCWRQSRIEGVSIAPTKNALRAVRDRLARHATLAYRNTSEGYVVVCFHGEVLAADDRAHRCRRSHSSLEPV